jgi:hypothetical protein
MTVPFVGTGVNLQKRGQGKPFMLAPQDDR